MKISALSLLMIAALGAAAAYPEGSTSPATSTRDSAIFVAVKSRLKAEHVDGYSHIDVRTDANGEVWLKGTLETRAQADRAVALAQATENVTAVHNELVVKSELVVKTSN